MADVDTAIDSYLGQRRQQTVEGLKLSVSNALTVNPDQEAEARRAASTLNIPVDTARDNLPEAQQQVRMQQTDFGMLADRFPKTSSYLSNQQNANLSHDDVDNLSNLESLVNPKAPSLTQLNEVIGQIGNFAKGSGMSILSGAGPAVSEGMWGGVRAAAEAIPGDLGSPLAAYAANKAKVSRGIKESWGGQSESMLGAGWNSGMQSLGMNLATLPLGFAGKMWPVLTAMGAITGGQSYGEARDQGVSVPTAFNYGLSQGMIEAGTEMIGMPALFSILKPGHFGTKALEYMLKEQGGEQIATALQDLNDWAVLPENKDKSFSDYLAARPDAAIQTALATAFGGGGQVALMKGVQLLVSRGEQQVANTEQSTALLEKLNEFAQASNTLRRDPDTFQQFIADASEDGPVQQVFIDANTLMQSGLAEQIAQVSPAVAEQLPVASQTGGQIAIPVDEYAARIAPTEYAQSLIDHLKTDPDGFTRAEAQEYMQTQGEQLKAEIERQLGEKAADDTFKQSAQKVRDNIKSQLDEVSRFKSDVNVAYADMVGKVFAVYAAKMGITPEEMYRRYPLRIAGASVGGQNLSQNHGAFGPVFHEFKGDYKGALAKLKEAKTGEAVGALYHPDIGDIDLVWGEEGTGKSDGYGLSKLLKFHPEVIDNLQDILNDMKIVRRVNIPGRERVDLESSEHRAGIRLTWDNEAKHWLLTAFKKKEGGGGAATYTDTSGLAGQDDTASLTDASDDIVDQKFNQFYQSKKDSYKGVSNGEWTADQELIDAAKKYFGTTTRPLEAGYVLPDGTMLDFTGRHETSQDNWRHMQDQRSVDHRMLFGENMSGFSMDNLLESSNGSEAMHEFMARTGAMRVDFRAGVVSIMRPPSSAQMNVAARNIGREYAAASYIDAESGRIIADAEWDNVNGPKLKSFFAENLDKKPKAGAALFQSPVFYSALERAITGAKQESMPADQWEKWITGNQSKLGIKKEEIEATGLREYLTLNGKEKLTKQQITDFMRDNGVRVQEVMKGEIESGKLPKGWSVEEDPDEPGRWEVRDEQGIMVGDGESRDAAIESAGIYDARSKSDTKYGSYTLPGGENYKELLLTLPSKRPSLKTMSRAEYNAAIDAADKAGIQDYKSSHWEESNILAHIRFNDRTDADGNKVLFIEEIQSDWAQEGRKRGFAEKYKPEDVVPAKDGAEDQSFWYFDVPGNMMQITKSKYPTQEEARNYILREKRTVTGGTPVAPFVKDTKAWVALSIKRMIAYAAENGYAKVAFVNGEQSAQRYDLSKQIDRVAITKTGGVWAVNAWKDGSKAITKDATSDDDLANLVGKELAERAIKDGGGEYSGLDLQVGGEGMKSFYDRIVPQVANDVLKKLDGGKVALVSIGSKSGSEFTVTRATVSGSEEWRVLDANDNVVSRFKTEAEARSDAEARSADIGVNNTNQLGFEITPEMRDSVLAGQALFQNNGEARGAFNPSTNTIALLQKADLSTFLHEAGHFFLEVQFDLAGQIAKEAEVFGHETNTEGQQTILADTNALLKWFGLRDLAEWDSLSFEEKRSYHEQFARGFEAYLFEGKSTSIEMQGLFQRFRAWLVNVYKSLKALNVDLTDEVRGVFDRMVATTEEIQLAEQGRSMFPMFESAEQAGMTPEEFAQYQALGIDATNDSIQELQAKGLRDMQWLHNARGREVKRLQKKAKALRAEAEIDARREVMSQPIYQAWSFLTRKIEADDKLPPVPEKTGDRDVVNPDIDSMFVAIAKLGGIQRESARIDLGVHKDVKSPLVGFGKYVLRNKGGMTVDNMAASLYELGYLTAHDLPEFEEKFTAELGGTPQYSNQYDYGKDLRAGEHIANPYALEAGRFDQTELNLMDLPTEIVNTIKAHRMTAKNGLHPDMVAEKFDFTSGDELVRKLAAATTPKEAIATLTDQLMLERHGELATPEAIAKSADQALHNNARSRFIATEANALAKATGQRPVLERAAKLFANSMVGRLLVRNVKPTQYANAEQRAAKAADLARRQGDLAQAAAEKRNQLVQNYAARSAYQALDDIESALKYFDRVQKPGKIPADYYDRIMALLSKFDLRKSVTLKELDNTARFRTWVTAQLNSGNIPPNFELLLSAEQRRAYDKELTRRNEDGELIYPDDESQAILLATYLDEQPVRSYKDLSVNELLGLRDAVMQIEHLGRRTQKVLTDRKNREFVFAIDQMRNNIREVAEKAGRRGTDNMTPNTKTGKEKLTVRGYFFDHIKAANLMHIIDGGSGGPLWEYLGRTANVAADGEAVDLSAAHDKIQELLALLKDGGKITGSGKFFESLGVSLNRQAIIALAMNLGNDSNRQRLLGGGLVVNGIPTMITMEQLQPALDTLTAKDWQFIQGMWDYYETFRPRVGDMERLINGIEPTWIEAVPFTVRTADGQELQLRGGYAPVIFDPRASGRASMFEEEKDAKAMLQAARVANTVRKSFTKDRVEEVKGRPLMLDLGAFIGAFQDTIHYLHWQPWIIDANRIVKTLDPTIREYYGHEVTKQLRNWVRDSAVGIQAPRTSLERMGAFMARNVSFAGLAFNFFNAIQQVTGYSQSVALLGSGWMMKGVSYTLRNPRQAYLEATEKSAFMRKRSQTRMRDIAETNLTVQDQNPVRTQLDRAGYVMMMTMQTAVDIPTWYGGYMKALGEGRDEADAIALADQAVIDSQGSGLKKDLAQYERESNGIVRLLVGFMSFMNVTMNLNYRTLRSDQSVGGKAADLILINAVPVALTLMLKALLMPKSGDDDKEPVEWAKDYALEQLSFMLGQLVFIRELSQIGYSFTGQGHDYGGPSGLRWVGDLGKAATQIGQGDADQALLKALINVAGDFLRLPSVQINRLISGGNAISEGDTENPGAILFGFRR